MGCRHRLLKARVDVACLTCITTAHAPPADPSPAPASAIPSQLLLVCGTATGTLDMATGRITHNGAHCINPSLMTPPTASTHLAGQHVTAPEFERLGGKSSAKKWKSSIRVDSASGTPLGDWLQAHGLDLRNNQIHRVNTPTRTASVRSAPRQQGGALPYLKLPHMHQYAHGACLPAASHPTSPHPRITSSHLSALCNVHHREPHTHTTHAPQLSRGCAAGGCLRTPPTPRDAPPPQPALEQPCCQPAHHPPRLFAQHGRWYVY